jgi:hypothetical protein
MSNVIYKNGFFPFPVVEASPWNGTDWYDFPLFDEDYNIVATASIPGVIGSPLSSGETWPDGSTTKYQYIPVIGTGTPYPIGMSLAAASEVFWRVRTWNLNLIASGGGFSTDPTVANLVIPIGGNNQTLSDAWTIPPIVPSYPFLYEPLLLTGRRILAYEVASIPGDNELLDYYVNIFNNQRRTLPFIFSLFAIARDFDIDPDNNFPFFDFDMPIMCHDVTTNLFYPYINFGPFNFQQGSGMTTNFKVKNLGSGITTGPIPIDSFTFDEPSLTFNFSASEGARGGGLDPSTNETIIFSPLEYWAYDPGDGGGPYYDTSTGAQLR